MKRGDRRLGRRGFVGVSVAAGVVASSGAPIAIARASGLDPIASSASPEASRAAVGALFGPIGPGTRIARWEVVAIHGIHLGAIPVVLATADGRRFQVDVLRADTAAGAPSPVATAAGLSTFLVNWGDGRTSTDEEQGLGAMALLDALAARIGGGAAVPELATWRERQARHPDGVYGVPLSTEG